MITVWWDCAVCWIRQHGRCVVRLCSLLYQTTWPLCDETVQCATSDNMITVWWDCAVSYIRQHDHCVVRLCSVIYQTTWPPCDETVQCAGSDNIVLSATWWHQTPAASLITMTTVVTWHGANTVMGRRSANVLWSQWCTLSLKCQAAVRPSLGLFNVRPSQKGSFWVYIKNRCFN